MTLSIGDDAKQIGGRAQPNPPLSIRCADPITSFDSSLLLAVDDVMCLFCSIPSDWRLPVSRFTHCRAINTFTKKKRRQGEEEETAHSFRLLLCVRSPSVSRGPVRSFGRSTTSVRSSNRMPTRLSNCACRLAEDDIAGWWVNKLTELVGWHI